MILEAIGSPNLAFPLEGMSTSQAAFGLEQAHPLLDKRIIELCLAMPPGQFVQDGWRRSLIRRAMEGVLPTQIRWRITKNPFTPDYHSRMLMARPWVLDFLSQKGMKGNGSPYVDKTKIQCQLSRVKPVREWNEWENDTPTIVGKGVIIESFHRWFLQTEESAQ
jgi:asparagine synthetase B (glutamine-hydrolysing)